MQIKHQRGYLVLAQNNDTTDYVSCAGALAHSIRMVEPDAKICLLTDVDRIQDPVFDIVKTFPMGDQAKHSQWKLYNDWQCFYASPFRQTIKIEADMIIPRNISHWFEICDKRDLVVTIGSRDYQNRPATSRYYRKIFDANMLPDAYNAITYWRLCPAAKTFFDTVREIFDQWDSIMQVLKYGKDQPMNTDLAYALALLLLGQEQHTLPGAVPGLIHMKSRINRLQGEDWTKELVWELESGHLRIGTVEQMWPVHYHIKHFSQTLLEHYGRIPQGMERDKVVSSTSAH